MKITLGDLFDVKTKPLKKPNIKKINKHNNDNNNNNNNDDDNNVNDVDDSNNDKKDVIDEDYVSVYNVTEQPIYDGSEPLYIFRRKMESYCNNILQREKYNETLKILNKIFKTKHKQLTLFRDIPYDNLPTIKRTLGVLKKYSYQVDVYNYDNTTEYVIDNILKRINYSFKKSTINDEIFYNVRLFRSN